MKYYANLSNGVGKTFYLLNQTRVPFEGIFTNNCTPSLLAGPNKKIYVYLWTWNGREFYLYLFFPLMTELDLSPPFLLPWLGISMPVCCMRQSRGQQIRAYFCWPSLLIDDKTFFRRGMMVQMVKWMAVDQEVPGTNPAWASYEIFHLNGCRIASTAHYDK